jgi:putative flippase GtrA
MGPLMQHETTKTLVRFVVYGAANVGISWSLYLVLLTMLGYRLAYVLSFISGIAIALVLNSKFVFKTSLTIKKAGAFVAAYGLQLGVGTLLLQLLIEHTAVSPIIAPLCVMVVTVPLSFLMSRYSLNRR